MNTPASHAATIPARTPVFGTLIGSMRPSARVPAIGFDAACVLLGSALIALCAQASAKVGFSPVPITGQTFAVLLIGAALGPRLAAAACIAYLVEGLAGLPVFSPTHAGPASIGYIIGFIPGAWLVGFLCQRGWDRRPWLAAAAMIVGLVPIFTIGLAWLMYWLPIKEAVMLGLVYCIPGEVIKVAAAALLIPSARAGIEMLRSK